MVERTSELALVAEYFRIEREGGETRIIIQTISWRGVHTPVSKWELGATIPGYADEAEIGQAVETLLHDPKFFAVCKECAERKPSGYMHDEHICQGCATRNHGVVY